MPELAIMDVDTAGGGLITSGSDSVLVNGKGVARVDDTIASHGSAPHDASVITTGSATVFIDGKAVARKGDPTSCGDSIETGSSTIFID